MIGLDELFATELSVFVIAETQTGKQRFEAFFESAELSIDTTAYSEIPTHLPYLLCKSADVKLIRKDDALTVNGINYIANIDPVYDPKHPLARIYLTQKVVDEL